MLRRHKTLPEYVCASFERIVGNPQERVERGILWKK